MKRLILFELMILFLATTFQSDSPPGWYQQVLPVNDQINDIFFVDSLTGWLCTAGASTGSDTGYVMKTSNGGDNWSVQYNQVMNLNVIQFLDINTGYSGGGNGTAKIFKTTNSGQNWNLQSALGFITVKDLFFVNHDTGWVCDDNPLNGGIYKTINGGLNWQNQLGASYSIRKIFFINKDTGWAGSADWKLYKTVNGGSNWTLQYTTNIAVSSIFFINGQHGWIRSGGGNGVAYTTNGGTNWTVSQGEFAGTDIKFVNDSIGYSGGVPNVTKSLDGGKTWGFQSTPSNTYNSVYALDKDSLHAWAGTYNFIKTVDGGGPIVGMTPINSEVPSGYELLQNYPNPFNSMTKIKYSVKRQTSNVKLVVFDVQGRFIAELVDQDHSAGIYETAWNAPGYSSGIYLYSLIIDGVTAETKKMLLLK